MKDSIISVHYLKKAYGEHIVLDGLNFEVERGSIFALLGENGAGKTTTVRILSTLIQADSGTATIAGYDTHHESDFVKQNISLTGQYASVDELLTGEENLMMMGRLNHLDRKLVKKRTAELLEQFELTKAAKKQVKTYSGGMRRRIDIAISLLASPQVIFLDEPTTGLDPRSRRKMWSMIQQLAKNGVTIFLTTQYLEEADQLADKIAVIDNGRIVEEGTAEELKNMIGDENLELTFADFRAFQHAIKLIHGLVNEKEQRITIRTGSIESLRRLLNTLYEHEIEPSSVNFQKPTLDDVFMDITSRNTKELSANA
ncbi:ABC-2 type transport system ATP-binding protein [Cytobacillus eiseniae]|uniref:ABC-2 type transport system ATP-binding protein n=1 Tax=Cytobacillus eiseniae TaxID=762947 RepID=A0ABS4RFW9_9BACI|nr:daunorubicin/doxorubicin resistance ABC transporter ATP-binding protein DrrA [Cytobacillus eiseniae]MBP2241794.1 ABC-2 type transport system ATP-binding protein [Cytobacillus eiseniae]